ncbi:MAG: Mrp/NBP35 family ATP-binding protein [Acidiphilium sp.]|nr:Mrp/NBP35 family ATP-binding protein [Acidiphilium sp.]MDD4935834.1 Mrp/NBP35 family ATP-binding protein [Acidiphilium sp.]
MIDEAAIRARIGQFRVADGSGLPAAMIDSVAVRDGMVQVALTIAKADAARLEPVRLGLEQSLAAMAGVRNATVMFTGPRAPAASAHTSAEPPAATLLGQVKSIIAVASGKGGVGKSTVAVNLAVSLAAKGMRVGLLDADIYGPSLPRMLGTKGKPDMAGNQLVPIDAWGLKAISIGHVVSEETAMVWRGPMVLNALMQLMTQVAWPALDVMVIDLPPGTGDIQLTLAQRLKLTGAVVVSTPQDIALLDARRGVSMFQQVRVPVLGIVENMSFFCCPNCGARTEIFGHGGARAEAARIGVPFLGEVPLLPAIRETSDAGTPIAVSAPGSEAALAFMAVAEAVIGQMAGERTAGPRIVIE